MPLPTESTTWPPKALGRITPTLAEWSAWWSGDPELLANAYRKVANAAVRPSQQAGGVVGALSRMWWGRPAQATGRTEQLHVPIAGDLCQASADLIYSEPPVLELTAPSLPDSPGQNRPDGKAGSPVQHQQLLDLTDQLNRLMENGLVSTLAEGAELGAALGGRYHRVTWDAAKRVFLSTVDADAAWPVFRWGQLVSVVFWHVVETTNSSVWRHVELHELDLSGNGVVQHALYQGRSDNLGSRRPLTDHEATRGLETAVDQDGYLLEARTPGLLVTYVPNQTPNRRWRTDPVGRHLGRSDLDGVEALMDALDETYSSWMRDIRIAKGRIHVPQSMLEDNGPGRGASFDLDREVYTGLQTPLSRTENGALPLVATQFAIRVEEHARTCQQLVEDILRSAGYSAQTFGEGPDNAAMTATEVQSRERRSYLTRSRKLRHEGPALRALLLKVLRTQYALGVGKAVPPDLEVSVVFGDAVQDSPLSMAQTSQALFNAKAASTKTRVRMQHPDWSDEQVDDEVDLILQEDAGAPVADPFSTVPPGAETVPPDPEAEPDAGQFQ